MKFPILTIFISASVISLHLVFGDTPREFIWVSGEFVHRPWSLISAHLVHISSEHLVWNVAALLILSSIVEQTSRREVMLAFGSGLIALTVYLLFLFPLDAYAGLSGILNSLLVVALYNLSRQENYRSAALITLIASIMKIAWELGNAASIFSTLHWPAVPEAHLVGWLAGAVFIAGRCAIQNGLYKKYKIITL